MSEHDGCEHDFDAHLMVVTGATPADGGVMICPVKGCECYATWSAPQLGSTRKTIAIPSEDQMRQLRERLQE